jgi:hypothetical protein
MVIWIGLAKTKRLKLLKNIWRTKMPNWCDNNITFSSTRKCDLERLKKKVYHKNYYDESNKGDRDCPFSFHKIIPYPRVNKCLEKLSKKREEQRNNEAVKKGFTSFFGMDDGYEKEEIKKRYPEIEFEGWYDWNCRNWGTKWNAKHITMSKIKKRNGIYYWEVSFDTAWSPPMPIFVAIANQFPNISFEADYVEEGNDYRGEFKVVKGIVVLDEMRNS